MRNQAINNFSIALLAIAALSGCGDTPSHSLAAHAMLQPTPVNTVQAPYSFSGKRRDYQINITDTGYLVRGNQENKQVNLGDTTHLQFNDFNVNLLIGEKAKTIPVSDLKLLVELYIAFMHRTPDADGLAYWIDQFRNGQSLDIIGQTFYNAAVLNSKYTGYTHNMSDQDFVKLIYKNVLSREDNQVAREDLDYWVGELRSGRASRGALVKAMLYSAHTAKGDPTWGWMADKLDEKYKLAFFVAVEQGITYTNPDQAFTHGSQLIKQLSASSFSQVIREMGLDKEQFNLYSPPPGLYLVLGQRSPGGAGHVDGVAEQSRLDYPGALVSGRNGDRYVLDQARTDDEILTYYFTAIRKIDAHSVTTTITNNRRLNNALVIDSKSNLYFIENQQLIKRSPSGEETVLLKPVTKTNLAIDSNDRIYFDDYHWVYSLSGDNKIDLPLGTLGLTIADSRWLPLYTIDDQQQVFYLNTNYWDRMVRKENHVPIRLLKVSREAEEEIRLSDEQGKQILADELVHVPVYKNQSFAFMTRRGIYKMNQQGQSKLFYDFGKMPIADIVEPSLGVNAVRFRGFMAYNVPDFRPFNFEIQLEDNGNVLINDKNNDRILEINSQSQTKVIAGAAPENTIIPVSEDSQFTTAIDRAGNFLIINSKPLVPGIDRIISVSPQGKTSILADDKAWWGRTDLVANRSKLTNVKEALFDSRGNLIIATRTQIWKISVDGTLSLVAGQATGAAPQDGIGSSATFGGIESITEDDQNNFYVIDSSSKTFESQGSLRKVSSEGQVKTIANTGRNLFTRYQSNFFYSVTPEEIYTNTVRTYLEHITKIEIIGNASVKRIVKTIEKEKVSGLVADSDGNIYYCLEKGDKIHKISSNGVESIVAGTTDANSTNPMRISRPRELHLLNNKTLVFISGRSLFKLVLP